jgi:hypothetical protein
MAEAQFRRAAALVRVAALECQSLVLVFDCQGRE